MARTEEDVINFVLLAAIIGMMLWASYNHLARLTRRSILINDSLLHLSPRRV